MRQYGACFHERSGRRLHIDMVWQRRREGMRRQLWGMWQMEAWREGALTPELAQRS